MVKAVTASEQTQQVINDDILEFPGGLRWLHKEGLLNAHMKLKTSQ